MNNCTVPTWPDPDMAWPFSTLQDLHLSLAALPWCEQGNWPAQVADWLLDTGSLTARLRALPGGLAVHCLQEASLANQGVRQVLLCKEGRAWVWGVTCFEPGFLSRWPALQQQGTRPLGDWLFAAGLTRTPLQGVDLARQPVWQPFCQALAWDGPLWARRCRWQQGTAGLMLYEIFLPAAPLYTEPVG